MPIGVGPGASSGLTTTPQTFANLVTACVNHLRESSSISTTTNIIKELLNQALQDVHIQQNWPWAERRGMLRTVAPYTTGAVSIASTARTALEGAGTAWNTTISGMGVTHLQAGGKIKLGGEVDVYTVASVASDTAATLDTRYIGGITTASAYALAYSTYTAFEDEYALASDFWRLIDLRQFSEALPIPILSRQEFYRRYIRNSTTGTPQVCTILDLGYGASTTPVYKVVFHPAPDKVLNIPYRFITSNLAINSAGTGQANMVEDSDEPIIPIRYRHVLIWYVLAHWYRDRKDDARTQQAEGQYVDLIRRMAGDVMPEKDHPRLISPRSRYLAGRAGRTIRRTRYATGTAWDELRE